MLVPTELEGPEAAEVRPWGQECRLEFIEFRLLWDGRINRSEVSEFFNVSIQQASLDFAKYMGLAVGNMEYDRSEKVYRVGQEFKPLLTAPDTQTYLNELSGLVTGTISPVNSFMGNRPACDVVQLPVRRVRTEVLLPILWAIRDVEEIDITYQSMRSPDRKRQWIAPHSLAFDGTRWHVRAWSHESCRFRDFVLTRFQQIHGCRQSAVNLHADVEWHTFFVVEIEPNPTLTDSQRNCVVRDFGMVDGKLSKTIRSALVPYFVRHLRIDGAHEAQPIVWANRSRFHYEDSDQPK